MAPVIHELNRRAQCRQISCATGQHRELLDPVLALFDIRPKYDLAVMQPDQTPAGAAALILERLEPILERERPDWLLVQGDTTTVAAAALAAFYNQIRVAHV